MTKSSPRVLAISASILTLILTISLSQSLAQTKDKADQVPPETAQPSIAPSTTQIIKNFRIQALAPFSKDPINAQDETASNTSESGSNNGDPAGNTTGGGSQIGGKLSSRAISRDRNAPRRESLQAIKIVKHLNGLFGGFEQGAGFGFGMEATTADSIPGVEVYARAMGSLRLYRKAEVGAIVGSEKTKGEVWLSYLRRTQDNFFGIGPRTSQLLETNYSIERRSFNGVFSHKFTDKLDAGIYTSLSNTGSFRGEDDSNPPIDALFSGNPSVTNLTLFTPGLNSNAKLFSYGVFAELDMRNNERGLTKGGYFYGRLGSTNGLKNGNAFSDYGWTEAELDGRVYIPVLSDKTSVALRAYTDLKGPKGGSQIPFYDLSWLGGRTFLRGFENYRFRGNNLLLLSGEVRQTVYPRGEDKGLDLIVFTDGGQVWGDNRSKINPLIVANDDFKSANWRIGAGGGFQYRVNKSTAFRFEIGASNEKTRAYFSLSRGF